MNERGYPLVSVVLPARNEADTIGVALRGLQRQSYPQNRVEIIVVDGESEDDTAAIVEQLRATDPRIRLLHNPDRVTPAALNIGIRAARGEVIVRMDGHAEAEERYIELGVAILREAGAWSVGGRMLKGGRTDVERANAVAASSPLGVGDAAHNFADAAFWAETVFLGIWPRWVFDRVGLFDEELVRNQDDEHAYRIRRAGGRIRYDPRLVVRYRPRRRIRDLFDQYRQYGYWKVRVFQKHPKAARPRHFIPAAWVGTATGLSVAAIWLHWARGLWMLVMATYLALVGAEGVRRRREAPPALTVASIAALHAGYGIGFLQGIARFGAPFRMSREIATSAPRDPNERDAELQRIRDAYAAYRAGGRRARWDAQRPGAARSIVQRDDWLLEQARKGRPTVVLDVGCGDGNVALTLTTGGVAIGKYIGIDLMDDRIALARERVPDGEFHVGSADRLPVAAGSVDLAVAFTLFSSVTDRVLRRAIAEELRRVVRPGGTVLVYDIRYPSPGNRNLRRLSPGEVRDLFPGWLMESRTMTLVPPLARTPLGELSFVRGLLDRIPILRSHLAVVLTRP